MRWRGAAIAVAGLVGQSPAAVAQATPPAAGVSAPDASSKLTGAAAWQALIGNTVVAKTRTGGYSEFYAPGGAVKHLDSDGTSTGTWTLKDPKVCFDYPEEDDASCVSIEIEGTKGAFIDEDATRDSFEVLPGNAKNL